MRSTFRARRSLLIIPASIIVILAGFFSHLVPWPGINPSQSSPTDFAINATTQTQTLPAQEANLPRSGQDAPNTILNGDQISVTPELKLKDEVKTKPTIPPGDQWIITPSQLASAPQHNATTDPGNSFLSLGEFTARIANGATGDLRGLYASGLMALAIVPQPDGDNAYIDLGEQTATRFQLADPYGMVGLLAHNYLAGRYFLGVALGQELILVYGDRQVQAYQVSEIDDFQRLTPDDLSSNFLELSSNVEETANEVFARFYEHPGSLTLQTCIERDGRSDWGVRFIVAEPVGK